MTAYSSSLRFRHAIAAAPIISIVMIRAAGASSPVRTEPVLVLTPPLGTVSAVDLTVFAVVTVSVVRVRTSPASVPLAVCDTLTSSVTSAVVVVSLVAVVSVVVTVEVVSVVVTVVSLAVVTVVSLVVVTVSVSVVVVVTVVSLTVVVVTVVSGVVGNGRYRRCCQIHGSEGHRC